MGRPGQAVLFFEQAQHVGPVADVIDLAVGGVFLDERLAGARFIVQ